MTFRDPVFERRDDIAATRPLRGFRRSDGDAEAGFEIDDDLSHCKGVYAHVLEDRVHGYAIGVRTTVARNESSDGSFEGHALILTGACFRQKS
jgi:hypothetical protein